MPEIRDSGIYPMRLQKFLARAGAASRRGSEDLMTAGRVRVNGRVTMELGTKVDPLVDEVEVDDIPVHLSDKATYLMLNKPAGYITTMSDPQGRPTAAELMPVADYPGLFPVGRLDNDTTGLLLFMTDGDMAADLLHPSRHVFKSYHALVDGIVSNKLLDPMREGMELDDGMCAPAIATLLDGPDAAVAPSGVRRNNTLVELTIHEGRKRQVKRMFSAIGHPVIKLDRVAFGPLNYGDLEQGKWRHLTAEEVTQLRDVIQAYK